MSTFVTSGFILKVRPWREGDRLYTILTQSSGKIEAVATAARRMFSKLSPHLLPFSEIDLMVARGRQFDRLASASLREIYLKPPFNLKNVILASTLLEVTDALTQPGQPEPMLLTLLRHNLDQLKKLPDDEDQWRLTARCLLARYLLNFFEQTGLTITLGRCDGCRGQLSEPVWFSWTKHSFYHQAHLPVGEAAVPLERDVLAWLMRSVTVGINESAAMPPAALAFLTDYLRGHIGRELYTLKVLRSVLLGATK